MSKHLTMDVPDLSFDMTYKGEPVTAILEIKGKIHLYTANHTYIAEQRRETFWRRLNRLWPRWTTGGRICL